MGQVSYLRRTRRVKDVRRLTGKQRLFVTYYLDTLNQTKAAELAGYKGGYATWRYVGSKNITKDNIRAAIDEGMAKLAMPREEVLARLTLMAKEQLLTRKDDTKDGVMDHYDVIKALELLGKHHRLFVDRVEHDGEICLIFDAPVPEAETEEAEKT